GCARGSDLVVAAAALGPARPRARRRAGPAPESSREGARVCEDEQERDLGDREAALLEVGAGERTARLAQEVAVGGAGVGESALQVAKAQAERARGGLLARLASGEVVDQPGAQARARLVLDTREVAGDDLAVLAE